METIKSRRAVLTAYPSGVGAFCCTFYFAAESKVGDFADELRVDQDVASSQVTMNVIHFRQILHAESDAAQHAQQLEHLELAIIGL